MRRTRLALPLLVSGALAAGCGSSGSGSGSGSSSGNGSAGTSKPAATPSLSPVSRVQAASQATSNAGSSRIALVTTSTVSGKDIVVKADGAVDSAERLGQLTVSLGDATSIEERFVGDDLYIAVPQQPGSFYKLAQKDLVGTSLGASASPTAGFQALQAASTDVTEVGKEKVRDADTTHYKGTYDAKAALDKVQGAAKDAISAAIAGSDLSAVPFDAYLDDQGRVRKFVQSLDVTAQGQQVHTTSTIETFDYGTPVSATAPPAEQVKDGAPLLQALKGSTG